MFLLLFLLEVASFACGCFTFNCPGWIHLVSTRESAKRQRYIGGGCCPTKLPAAICRFQAENLKDWCRGEGDGGGGGGEAPAVAPPSSGVQWIRQGFLAAAAAAAGAAAAAAGAAAAAAAAASTSSPISSSASPLRPLRNDRRSFVARFGTAAIAFAAVPEGEAWAASATQEQQPSVGIAPVDVEQTFVFAPPNGFQLGNKPLKTHLYEVQYSSSSFNGYKMGITVDPVRIASLSDFGTPREVAARVVTTELSRDGVDRVTLVDDPQSFELATPGGDGGGSASTVLTYELNYRSEGKRGTNRFVCKLFVQDNKLYVLTSQCKESDYPLLQSEIEAAVNSFRLVP
jgi:hypothetical protein